MDRSPCGSSGLGGRYVTALMYRDPARKVTAGLKPGASAFRIHEIAVLSREAERTRSLVGAATARTWKS